MLPNWLAGWQAVGSQQSAVGRFSLIVQFSVSCSFWAAAVDVALSLVVAFTSMYVQESLV